MCVFAVNNMVSLFPSYLHFSHDMHLFPFQHFKGMTWHKMIFHCVICMHPVITPRMMKLDCWIMTLTLFNFIFYSVWYPLLYGCCLMSTVECVCESLNCSCAESATKTVHGMAIMLLSFFVHIKSLPGFVRQIVFAAVHPFSFSCSAAPFSLFIHI